MKKTTALCLIGVAAFVVSCAHHQHSAHTHVHGPGCGHLAVTHDGHTDYLDDGHLHHVHGTHVDEHVIAISATNPDLCTPGHGPAEHPGHTHSATCGHPAVPHGHHTDYLVNGHLDHPHGDHCDDHGPLLMAAK